MTNISLSSSFLSFHTVVCILITSGAIAGRLQQCRRVAFLPTYREEDFLSAAEDLIFA